MGTPPKKQLPRGECIDVSHFREHLRENLSQLCGTGRPGPQTSPTIKNKLFKINNLKHKIDSGTVVAITQLPTATGDHASQVKPDVTTAQVHRMAST
ncbi:hypothetical protein METHP14_70035 [Pseudomonas sp. P14-2025]